jgi:hypothetical protein
MIEGVHEAIGAFPTMLNDLTNERLPSPTMLLDTSDQYNTELANKELTTILIPQLG